MVMPLPSKQESRVRFPPPAPMLSPRLMRGFLCSDTVHVCLDDIYRIAVCPHMRFRDRGTEDVANGRSTKAARATLPLNLLAVAIRKLDALNFAQHWTISAHRRATGLKPSVATEKANTASVSTTNTEFALLGVAVRQWMLKSSTTTRRKIWQNFSFRFIARQPHLARCC